MKKQVMTIGAAIVFAFGSATFTGCSSGENNEATEQHEDGEEHAYACPMHPEITGEEGDDCSKCGMKLEIVAHEH